MKLRVLIAEDQPDARAWLVGLVSRLPDVSVIADVGNGEEACQAIRRLLPNLVLLDVQMPLLDGIGVVEVIGPVAMPPTIFVTAHDAYAIRAFELNALDYLLKPFGPARLNAAVERARKHLRRDEAGVIAVRLKNLIDQVRGGAAVPQLTVRSERRNVPLEIERIDWIEAQRNGVLVHTDGDTYPVRENIETFVGRLPQDLFVRIHKSYAINISCVAELRLQGGGNNEVVLTTGTRLRLSRHRRDLLQEKLGLESQR